MKDSTSITLQRIVELSAKLEARARECPGLYPVKQAQDFIRIASDRLETAEIVEPGSVAALPGKLLDDLCHWLESMHRHPETSYQINSLSLIRRGANSPFVVSGNNSLLQSGS